MILLLHIAIALTSIAVAAYGLFSPSKTKLHASYCFIAATIATGAYLVVMAPAHMLEVCTVGLLYTGIMIIATVAVRRKITAAAERA